MIAKAGQIIAIDSVKVDNTLSGDGVRTPLGVKATAPAVETTLNSFSTALTNLASKISSLGSSITLKDEGTCANIGTWMQNAETGDAYIAADSGNVWGYNVNKGDMVVKLPSTVSVLSTVPDLSLYAKLSELPTIVPGANIVVTPTIVDGHTQYMITSVGGGGGADMAYQFTSNDSRFIWSQSADDPESPTVMTETLNVNLPKFEAVTSMPETRTPNTYYFVYEE